MSHSSSEKFTLKGSSEFSSRVADTFKDLLRPSDPKEEEDPSSDERPPSSKEKPFERPPSSSWRNKRPHNHSVRGWKKDPSKYTKYDLSDVEVSSDKGNASAAFSFLREVRKRRKSADGDSPPPPNLDSATFSFKKPRRKDEASTSKSSSSRRLLPEAVVGQRVPKAPVSKPRLSVPPKEKSNTLTLSHLEEDAEDSE